MVGVEDSGAQLFDGLAVGPKGSEADVCKARVDGCPFAVAEQDLDELEVEIGRVEGLELVRRIWRWRVVSGHDEGVLRAIEDSEEFY